MTKINASLAIIIGAIALFAAVYMVGACVSTEAPYSLNVVGLKIDAREIEVICASDTCVYDGNYLVLKSRHNDKVAVVIYKGASPATVTIRLPYKTEGDSASEKIIPGEINPAEYDWKASVKAELDFFLKIGALSSGDSEIWAISMLADAGKNIEYCQNGWRQYEANCHCVEATGEIICTNGCSSLAFAPVLPKQVLSEPAKPTETPRPSPSQSLTPAPSEPPTQELPSPEPLMDADLNQKVDEAAPNNLAEAIVLGIILAGGVGLYFIKKRKK